VGGVPARARRGIAVDVPRPGYGREAAGDVLSATARPPAAARVRHHTPATLYFEQTRTARPSGPSLRLYRAVLRIRPAALASWVKRLLRVRRRVVPTKYGEFLDRATRYRVATETVPALTLAQVLARCELDAVDLLKVDIEGFEYEAVLGSAELFRERRVRAVALELHPTILARRGLDPERVLAVFRDAGYVVDARFRNCVLRAPA